VDLDENLWISVCTCGGDAFVISLPSGLSSAICLEIVGKTSFHPAGNGSTAFFMHCLSHTLISNRHASVALFEFIAFLIIRLGLVYFWVGWLVAIERACPILFRVFKCSLHNTRLNNKRPINK